MAADVIDLDCDEPFTWLVSVGSDDGIKVGFQPYRVLTVVNWTFVLFTFAISRLFDRVVYVGELQI
jgi:hypothetical protein